MKQSKAPPAKEQVTRRAFLKSTSSAVVGGALLRDLGNASSAEIAPASQTAQSQPGTQFTHSHRLLTGWEYRLGGLGGVWEVWRKAVDDATIWQAVELPHCFNALDAVDPDAPYYQGPWARRGPLAE